MGAQLPDLNRPKSRRPPRGEHAIWDDLTLEQFLRLPEAKPALEYIDGKVIQKVSPKRKHSVIQLDLGAAIQAFARGRQLGRAYPELRCTFDGRSIVPDLCYFARGRIPRDERGKLIDDVSLPPDLAIEIISPGQTVKNLAARLSWCLKHGVRLGWLIQPSRRRVLVFRPGQPVERLAPGQVLDGGAVLPGFQLALDVLFGWIDED